MAGADFKSVDQEPSGGRLSALCRRSRFGRVRVCKDGHRPVYIDEHAAAMRYGNPRDLQNIFGANGKIGRLRDKVADFAEKVVIARRVKRPARGNAMIFVDLFLQLVAKPQLVANMRRELAHETREPAPKLVGADIR